MPGKVSAGRVGPEIVIIAAMAKNRVIGRDNSIPWHLPEDLVRFRARTMGHVLIMGRRTWLSIGRPLPGRRIVVLSRDPEFDPGPDVETAAGLAEAIDRCRDEPLVFIAGGGTVYRQTLPLADRIVLTVLDRPVAGDTLFPELPLDRFELIDRQRVEGVEPFTVYEYRRRPAEASAG